MNLSHEGFFLPPPPATINSLLGECYQNPNPNPNPDPCPNIPNQGKNKWKRNSSRELDEETEVVALSPKSLMAKYRFRCEECNKGFQREQNLQLHRRGHNLPWKLKQRGKEEAVKKKVYVCPEGSCVHHEASRALGDLTGIKKHFSRKHGVKKWKCDKCPKKYAVVSDLKAHSKICGTRQYKCHCGSLFSRKDSFMSHRAFCEAQTEERIRNMSCSRVNPNHSRAPDFINSASAGFFPFPAASQRLDFMALEASSSNGSNSMDGLRLPLWYDQGHQLIPEPHHTMMLKEEEEEDANNNRPSWSTFYKSPITMPAATMTDIANSSAIIHAFNDNASIHLQQGYIGNPLCGDGSFENGSCQQGHNNIVHTTSMGVGMRDFLGGLGGNTNGGQQGQTGGIHQQEMAYTKFSTMADDVSPNIAAAGDHQEPYMDFMN